MPTSNSNIAASLDIQCRRGDSFTRDITVTVNGVDFDFTGAEVVMHVRPFAGSSTVLLSFTEGAGITNNGLSLTLYKSGSDMNINGGKFVYDLEVTRTTGEIVTYLSGYFIITNDRTR